MTMFLVLLLAQTLPPQTEEEKRDQSYECR